MTVRTGTRAVAGRAIVRVRLVRIASVVAGRAVRAAMTVRAGTRLMAGRATVRPGRAVIAMT
ncbi:MAG TPA: hypothetical protein VGQ05_06060 [Streptosporangiaceae bacterium]|nr:hypothetical protein [Streptosporangiaceae bacterium]